MEWMGKKDRSVLGDGGGVVGAGCGWGGVVVLCCVWEVLKGCSCQVNAQLMLQCTTEGVQVVGDKCIRWKSVPRCYCLGKEAVFVVVVRGGYLSVFVWVVGSCLAVSGLEALIGIDV